MIIIPKILYIGVMLFLQKSQPVRLLDVLVLGPFLIWYGLKYDYSKKQKETVEPFPRTFLLCIGFYTIIYNAYNFIGNYTPLYPLL